MGESKRRKKEITELKAKGPKPLKDLLLEQAAEVAQSAAEPLPEAETFAKKEGETFADFTHRILDSVKNPNDQVISEILCAGSNQILGSEVFPDREQVVLYYKDRSCLKVQFLRSPDGDSIKVDSGKEIVIPAHVKTLQ